MYRDLFIREASRLAYCMGFTPPRGGGVRESVNVLLLGSYIGCTSLILSREAVTKLESVIARVGTS